MSELRMQSNDSQLGVYFTDSVPNNDLSTIDGVYDLAGKNVSGVYDLTAECRYT